MLIHIFEDAEGWKAKVHNKSMVLLYVSKPHPTRSKLLTWLHEFYPYNKYKFF